MKPLLLAFLSLATLQAAPRPLFDGKTLDGWEIPPGEEKWWKVQDGALTGGILTENVPTNLFLSTTGEYRNFELTLKIKLTKGDGFINSGIQVRSMREPGKGAMKGYQVDAGIGYWGDLYDEHRRDTKIAGALDAEALKAAVKDWEWNDYRIRCEGRRIRSWINGVPALDYTERDTSVSLDGKIAFQVHSGGKCLVQVKDVAIEQFGDTPGAPGWSPVKPPIPAPVAATATLLSADEEKAAFKLPDGFVAELVASEIEGVGKPITVMWDAKGRLWTMTALEYPVDANENKASAEALYARGGKDKVLVFDNPAGKLPLKPRVFADGLAIPLGILPDLDGNGALVHYGSQIRHYVDSNNDGKADKFDVVLEGFGIQDSHLMPHQFERGPGGWIYVAQGLFNHSVVTRPGGIPFADGTTSKPFNACKLARFRPDGSAFELLTAGPNNIWGLAQAKTGETWIQEANDIGIPITEFIPGVHLAGGSSEKLRPYAPQMPPTMTTAMGGTGLSGLALVDNKLSAFATQYGGKDVIYVANPITNRIQVISSDRGEDRHPEWFKREDFLVSTDACFRPVSVQFGPDGFLYIADWYNKIISHNEVPRNHPDRDKSHGRIWRIRPVKQAPNNVPDFTKLDTATALKGLYSPDTRITRMAIEWLADKNPKDLPNLLKGVSAKSANPVADLWVLEQTGRVTPKLLADVLAMPGNPTLRYEAVRAAAEAKIDPAAFVQLFAKFPEDPNYRVRAGLANAVRLHPKASPEMIALVAKLGREPLTNRGVWETYDRNFERYLTRWAMETHAAATEEMLAKNAKSLEPEARLLAIQALPAEKAAALLVGELPGLARPLTKDELSILGSQLGQPAVLSGFEAVLNDTSKRKSVLVNLTRLDPSQLANPSLAKIVSAACQSLLKDEPGVETRPLILQVAKLFRLSDLEPVIATWAETTSPADAAAAVAALREMKSGRIDLFEKLLASPDEPLRREALGALAAAPDPKVVAIIAAKWDQLPGAMRTIAVNGLTADKEKAAALASAAGQGGFKDLEGGVIERLLVLLGDKDPAIAGLLKQNEGLLTRIIRLPGNPKGIVPLEANLEGPFTVETWIRLDPTINNSDNILGRKGGADFNFSGALFRIYGGPAIGDLITANRAIEANVWTHVAVTRDAEGKFKLFMDGELDQDKGKPSTAAFTGLNIGETNAGGGTGARYYEFRIWDIARTPDEIRTDYHTSFAGATPAHLVKRVTGDEPGKLNAPAAVELTREFPALITAAQAAANAEKYQKYRTIIAKGGDAPAGRAVFQNTCMICHQVKDEGARIGPDLSGAGAMGVEALLRNILDPNAQLESGYYRHDVTRKDGSLISGFLVSESKDALTIRPIGAEPTVIPRADVVNHNISKRSLMPEGLLDGFNEKQVADLFSYLNTLK